MGEASRAKASIMVPISARATWVRWQIVAILMAYSFMSWFNRVSFSVADRPIMKEFDFSSTQIGMIDSALLLAYMLCMTPGGWFIDYFGPRRALVVMGFGSAVFVALTGLAGHALLGAGMAFLSFLVIRALMGSASAPIYPASAKMVSHWVPFTQRAWANGLITGAAPVGMAAFRVRPNRGCVLRRAGYPARVAGPTGHGRRDSLSGGSVTAWEDRLTHMGRPPRGQVRPQVGSL